MQIAPRPSTHIFPEHEVHPKAGSDPAAPGRDRPRLVRPERLEHLLAAFKSRLKRLLALRQYNARSKTTQEVTGSATAAFPAKPEEEAWDLREVTQRIK